MTTISAPQIYVTTAPATTPAPSRPAVNPYDANLYVAPEAARGGLFQAVGCTALLALMAVICIGMIWLMAHATAVQ